MTAKTKVFLFANWTGGGNEGWIAMAETGQIVCGHISSSRWWGLHDVSPQMHEQDYIDTFGPDYAGEIELIEVPSGEMPPSEVVDRYHAALSSRDDSTAVS